MQYIEPMSNRILVVEDNEDTRLILKALFTYKGLEMISLQTAEEMFERLDEIKPDLIVLDVRLPGMDGCEALQHLRALGFPRPIFMFSEYYDLFAESIRTCTPDAFYPKSKGPVILVDAIVERLSTAA